jgi:hypothetical protein
MSRPSGQPIRRVRGGQRGQLTVEAVGLLQLRGVAAAAVVVVVVVVVVLGGLSAGRVAGTCSA